MKYAEVKDSTIIKTYNELPKVWKNISGFHTLSDIELSNLDWSGNIGYKFYPYIEDEKPNVSTELYNIHGPIQTLDESEKKVYGSWSPSPIATEEAWNIIRTERTQLLYACDWTQLPDAPLTEQQKTNWATYRQVLRDITNQADPFNISWPTEPVA